MNLTDLRDELDIRALEIDQPGYDIAAGAHHKVRQIRRRRTAAAGTACVAALVSGGLVLGNLVGHRPAPLPATRTSTAPTLGADGMPYRVAPHQPGDVVKDGLRYRATLGGDTLAAAAIGDRGQNPVTLTWTPKTKHVSYASTCSGASTDHTDGQRYLMEISLGGERGSFASGGCDSTPATGDLAKPWVTPGTLGEGDASLALDVPSTVTVRLVDARTHEPVRDPGVRLTVAVYEVGTKTPLTDGKGTVVGHLPVLLEHQGYDYALSTMSLSSESVPLPTAKTPAGVPFLVSFGSVGDAPDTATTLYLTGLDETSARNSAGGWGTMAQRARGAGEVKLRLEGPEPVNSVPFIAIYTLEH